MKCLLRENILMKHMHQNRIMITHLYFLVQTGQKSGAKILTMKNIRAQEDQARATK